MGFKFSELGKSICNFKTQEEGDDRQDLLDCIQKALATSRLEIIIDLTGRPQALEHIMPEILSLQRVLLNHSKTLKIKGLGDLVPPDLLAILGQHKIELEFAVPTEAFASHDLPMQSVNDLPPPTFTEDVSTRLMELKSKLASIIRKKRDLELEKKFYDERLKVLQMGHLPLKTLSGRDQNISLMEKQHIELNDQVHILSKQAEEAQALLKVTEAQIKTLNTHLIDEFKKKKEPLDKKIGELKAKQDKAKAEFDRKSKQRISQLSSLAKSSKPTPT